MTRWQLKLSRSDQLAANDHSDWRWDEDVLRSLTGLARKLHPIVDQLENALTRFAGYPHRFDTALARVDRGERRWVGDPKLDSCHTVRFQLHEDLLATLGLERGA